jgi:prolyl-tRNA editing enzyme YbaK/EbsC (Cys-tRNA(Pro) deacylase)
LLNKITSLLDAQGVEYREVHHAPTRTSEEAADARGEDLSIGGKALVLKIDNSFRLFVLSASKRIDSVKIKRYFHAKRIRFATEQELDELTKLVPGSVPPFGKPLFDLELYVDRTIVKNKKIAFNAGSLTDSIIMGVKDYVRIAKPEVFDFSKI